MRIMDRNGKQMKLTQVSVLMSTYNGEKYIQEQIDSILKQKDVEVKLLIRDDGSRDNTSSICREYEEKHPNISFYQGANIGVGRSFMELLKNAPEAEYYSFADQDDVWLEDKLKRAVSIIQEAETKDVSEKIGEGYPITSDYLIGRILLVSENKVPILYGSNQMKVDENLNATGLRFKNTPKCDFLSSLSTNVIYGCTMVMNRKLREICVNIANPSEKVLRRKNHDGWSLYIAYIVGIFVYDSESHILYREHANQVVGAKEVKGIEKLKDQIQRLISARNKKVRSTLAKELLIRLPNEMNPVIKSHLEILSKADTLDGIRALVKDDDLVETFGESKGKTVVRGIMRWI